MAVLALLATVLGVAMVGGDSRRAEAIDAVDEGCPETSPPETHAGSTLEGFASDASGVVFDTADAELRLQKSGGLFRSTTLPVSDNFNAAAAADFDNDGWTDIVVGQSSNSFIRFYKNETYRTAEPDWSDPSAVRQPRFVRTTDVRSSGGEEGNVGIVAGDFDQDGNPDFFYYKNLKPDDSDLDIGRIYLGRGDGTFKSPYDAADDLDDFGYFAWSSTNAFVADWNEDGWPDIIFGTKLGSNGSQGAVLAFLNDCPDVAQSPAVACSTRPSFRRTEILTGIDLGSRGANALAFADFTGDGIGDLVIGAPSCCGDADERLRLYPGLEGRSFSDSYDVIPSKGAATVLLTADFSLDGKADLVTGSDDHNYGNHIGGEAFYYRNAGGSLPFAGGADQQLSSHQSHSSGNLYDFDLGVVLDYDHDPDATADFLIADGNDAGTFFLFANRVVSQFVECGDVASGVLDLGDLAEDEIVVTAARLAPTMSLPGDSSVTFYMSNEEPANWQLASPCPSNSSEYCVSFPKPVGRNVRWKATLCSDSSRTRSPAISGVEIAYDYMVAEEHYRAGVVVHDGIAYLGGFHQPGDRGRFYAANAGLTTTYWEASAKLDAMADSARNIYTSTPNGKNRLDFTIAAAATPALADTLEVASEAQARNVIEWARGARFGLGGGATPKSRLGAIETSTAAVIGPPVRPNWYFYADDDAKRAVEEFVAEHADRPVLVMFGSKDGAVHGLRSVPTSIASEVNGSEAWAFVPPKVAARMAADLTTGVVSAYPDGSPSVADVRFADGTLHTVAIIGSGNGGSGIVGLDVTETIDEESGAVIGPDPLWSVVPGGGGAGPGHSKPGVARVSIDGSERFIAILATGPDATRPNKGKVVQAVDVATGERLWRAKARCAVTSDILVFETDDELEPGDPTLDGFIDRAVWADACGYVYKVDPARDLDNGWLDTGELGSIDTGRRDPSNARIRALFSTDDSDCALGGDRPIVGTLGARPDESDRMTLFFGTGGIESYDPSKRNAFYAVYADSGEIRGCNAGEPERGVIAGECVAGECEKFYGGVVVTESQVLVSRAVDPPVGLGMCVFGSSTLDGFAIDDLDAQFSIATSAASVSSLYGDAGAVYFSTLAGDIVRVGTPRAAEAGGDSEAGIAGTTGGGAGELQADGLFRLSGWRQVR